MAVSAGAGWAGVVPVAGNCSVWAGGVPVTTELSTWWPDMYASPRDVSMNMMAAPVVALLRNVDAPVLPKRVWLPPPPKAAPISAPLPVWSKTIMMSATQTIT